MLFETQTCGSQTTFQDTWEKGASLIYEKTSELSPAAPSAALTYAEYRAVYISEYRLNEQHTR